ncbi:MAG: hypothetical protein LBS34_01245 [Rickettsiales bacterium]|jgi:hypothetical protein|nr:hypothetical protein [Rickettsiales bacterium]
MASMASMANTGYQQCIGMRNKEDNNKGRTTQEFMKQNSPEARTIVGHVPLIN